MSPVPEFLIIRQAGADERLPFRRLRPLSAAGVEAVLPGFMTFETDARSHEYELLIRQEPDRAKVCTNKEKGNFRFECHSPA